MQALDTQSRGIDEAALREIGGPRFVDHREDIERSLPMLREILGHERLQPREIDLNDSAVLKKEKDGWRFQALHFSNLVEEEGPPSEEEAAPAGTPAPKPETAPKKAQ